ncbi:MAG: carbohydrate ABC transporter permease [Treponema sp.]|jgi:multiple sugar transport system permease protein|nr:carbohydrate ABC transporter permease [Treponema sp.]
MISGNTAGRTGAAKRFGLSRALTKAIVTVVCLVIAYIMVVPFVWMISASFKPNSAIFSYPVKWIPEVFYFGHYDNVLTEIPFLVYFFNSAKLAVVITLLQLFTCSLAAYSFSKLRFPGRDKIFLAYLATMMVPWHAIMIPQFIIVKGMGMYNTHWSLIVLQAFSAFGVFLLRQNMISIPNSLSEAARIDGCSTFRIYWNIILPLTKTGLATLSVLTFNGIWNDYMGPMIYLDSDYLRTIQIALAGFREQYSANYGAILAGTVISIIPIVVVYICAQKYIVEGIAYAGVKG